MLLSWRNGSKIGRRSLRRDGPVSRSANAHQEDHGIFWPTRRAAPSILAPPGSSPGSVNDWVWTPGLLTRLASHADASFHLREANGTRRRPDVGACLGRSLPSLPLISEVVFGHVWRFLCDPVSQLPLRSLRFWLPCQGVAPIRLGPWLSCHGLICFIHK